jgi:hypothetical protein
MMNQVISRCFSNNQKTVVEVTSATLIIEALCAHRDHLLLTEDYDTPVIKAKLSMLEEEIREIWNQLPV